MARQVLEKHEILNNYAENSLETTRSLFREIDHQILSLNSKELAYKLAQRPIPEGNSHGRVARGYISTLIGNARVVRYLAQHYPEYLKQFQAISEITSLGGKSAA